MFLFIESGKRDVADACVATGIHGLRDVEGGRILVAPDAQKMESKRAEVVVNIRWHADAKKAEFVIDDHVYPTAGELTAPLKAAKAIGEKQITKSENPNFRALIRGDQDAPALYISQAMNACGDAGISDISFSALNK